MNLRNTFLSSLLLLITSVSCAEQPLVQFVLPSKIPATYKEYYELQGELTYEHIVPRAENFVLKRCNLDPNSVVYKKDKDEFGINLADYLNDYTEKIIQQTEAVYKVHNDNLKNNTSARTELANLTNEYINFNLNIFNQIDELFVEQKKDTEKSCHKEIAEFLQTVNQKNR
ncbi:MAG: hypothetical protein BWY54_00335 [Candidatus Dependentiae bacterium ADurb.Bin331]|nr:MAG: hypothetical protein BWY54_00335 [Candidatus Dependentiae bacterium ADurb.Bin331]